MANKLTGWHSFIKELKLHPVEIKNLEEWLTEDIIQHLLELDAQFKKAKHSEGVANSINTGRPRKEAQIKQAVEMYRTGAHSTREIARRTGIARATLYRNLDKY